MLVLFFVLHLCLSLWFTLSCTFNSYVYDIKEVVDEHTLRLHMPAKATDTVTYSIGRRSYGKFTVSNCDFYLLDTRGARDMHDTTDRGKKGLSMLGPEQRDWLLNSMKASKSDFSFVISTVPFMIPHSGAGGFEAAAKDSTRFTDSRSFTMSSGSLHFSPSPLDRLAQIPKLLEP